jgi:hypothetical protein
MYPLGADRVASAWSEGGNAAVRRLGGNLPRQTLDYMASLSHTLPTASAAPPCEIDSPAAVFELQGLNRFGAILLYTFLTLGAADAQSDPDAAMRDAAAWQQALSWSGDTISVYLDANHGDPRVAFGWRIRMTNEASARATIELATARALDGVEFDQVGSEIVVLGSDHPELLSAWRDHASCAR